MKLLQMSVVAVLALALVACDGGESGEFVAPEGPELQEFYLVDSYYVDSRFDQAAELALSPYEYDGWFELSWEVRSRSDYTVLIGVNDRRSMRGATIIGSDLCGAELSCDRWGDYVCRYTSDLYLGCGQVEEEAEANLASVDYLIEDFPQAAYLILEICATDGSGCELSSLPVWLE